LWDVSGAGELVLTAMDKEWFANRVSMKVTIVKADTTAPYIMKDKTYVIKEWNKYRVVIVINDDLSGVEWGTISQNWKTLNTFKKNYAEFYMTTPWVVNISTKDSYGNILNDTLDVTQYIPDYKAPAVENTQQAQPEVQQEPEAATAEAEASENNIE